jgi:hypothetical protein
MEFTDTEQAIRDVFRQYMTNELEPRTEAFESGEESIFPFMRKMIKDLGLDTAMGQGDNDGSAGERAAKEPMAEDEDARSLAAFAQTQLGGPVSARCQCGQALPRRSRNQGRHGGHTHPRRVRLHGGVQGRAADARCNAARVGWRHNRNPDPHDRPSHPRRVRIAALSRALIRGIRS